MLFFYSGNLIVSYDFTILKKKNRILFLSIKLILMRVRFESLEFLWSSLISVGKLVCFFRCELSSFRFNWIIFFLLNCTTNEFSCVFILVGELNSVECHLKMWTSVTWSIPRIHRKQLTFERVNIFACWKQLKVKSPDIVIVPTAHSSKTEKEQMSKTA